MSSGVGQRCVRNPEDVSEREKTGRDETGENANANRWHSGPWPLPGDTRGLLVTVLSVRADIYSEFGTYTKEGEGLNNPINSKVSALQASSIVPNKGEVSRASCVTWYDSCRGSALRCLVSGVSGVGRRSIIVRSEPSTYSIVYTIQIDPGKQKNSSPPRGSNSQPSDHSTADCKSLTLYPIELGGRYKAFRFRLNIYDIGH